MGVWKVQEVWRSSQCVHCMEYRGAVNIFIVHGAEGQLKFSLCRVRRWSRSFHCTKCFFALPYLRRYSFSTPLHFTHVASQQCVPELQLNIKGFWYIAWNAKVHIVRSWEIHIEKILTNIIYQLICSEWNACEGVHSYIVWLSLSIDVEEAFIMWNTEIHEKCNERFSCTFALCTLKILKLPTFSEMCEWMH